MTTETEITVSDAAQILSVTTECVYSLMRRGHLPLVEGPFGRKLTKRAAVLRRLKLKEAGNLPHGGPSEWKTTTAEAAAKAKKPPKHGKNGKFKRGRRR